MDNFDGQVRILSRPDLASHVASFYDPRTGEYFSPVVPGMSSEASEAELEDAGPAHAILDTGLLRHHPYIRNRIVGEVDFTGEGPEDENGHGTLVTLLTLAEVPTKAILNVKIMNAKGFGEERWLIQGLDWVSEWARKNRRRTIANISAGVFHRRFGLLPCKGDCSVTAAAKRADEAQVFLCMAAGNSGPSVSPCPQLGALRGLFCGMVIAEIDPLTGEPMPYSGPGNIKAAVHPAFWHRC